MHLAKLMPTQWRTIAPIVGRTATQCLERYQKLLDDAEAQETDELGLGDGGDSTSKPADGARGLRPGEIDPDPESRPARPDPVDMDDDEKEMLSEARARLANTQGKKAKRKARERQLEEARRVAFLQKKRELKAAGINLRAKPNKKGMDYNADIPFEKQPAPGFYDTAEERAKTFAAPVGSSLRALEGKRKQELEEGEQRAKRQKGEDGPKQGSATQFVQAREAQIRKLKEQEKVIRRRKLNLPTPQVDERELEEIVKIGQAGEAARGLVASDDKEGATDQLVSQYDNMSQARMARTPRIAQEQNNIMNEARNLRHLSSAQTPLLGGENTPMHSTSTTEGTGFTSSTPKQQDLSTPNPLATPRAGAVTSTRTVGGTPLRTPARDNFSINQPAGGWGETPSDERRRARDARRALQAGFASLPKPENNFELAEDEEEEEEEGDEVPLSAEDAADRDARLKAAREREEKLELERRSTVVKKGLPRPANVDTRQLLRELDEATADAEAELAAALKLVNLEMAALMKHDSVEHPLPGTTNPGNLASTYDMPEDEFVAAAKAAIHSELAGALGLPGASDAQVRALIATQAEDDESAFSSSWSATQAYLVYSPTSGWVEPSTLSSEELSSAYTSMISASRERMIADATRAAKAEKKLGKQLGGYMALNAKAKANIATVLDEIQQAQRNLETFSMLRTLEEAAAPARIEAKREEVATLERRERDLQARYAELNDRRRAHLEAIEGLEEDKVVLEAQAALDAQENGH